MTKKKATKELEYPKDDSPAPCKIRNNDGLCPINGKPCREIECEMKKVKSHMYWK